MSTPAKPTPEEIEAAEWLVSPLVEHGTEWERGPMIPEIALRLRALRAEWSKPSRVALAFCDAVLQIVEDHRRFNNDGVKRARRRIAEVLK